jgi:uncharacterized membrane protein
MTLLQTMAAVYILAGIFHFLFPKPFLKIVPKYIPYPLWAVYVSGFFEILFGLGLLFPQTQSYAAIGLILLLIAVFPANLYMAQRMKEKKNKYAWIAFARLPLQLVLIYWAWMYI